MRTEPRSIAPLLTTEYEAFTRLLAGDTPELRLLRCQLDSIRFASEYYRPRRFFFVQYRPRYVSRHRNKTRLEVQWGDGAEDWMLGDRRELAANDLIARLSDDSLAQIEVKTNGGVLQSLSMNRVWGASGVRRSTHHFSFEAAAIKDFLYFDGENVESASTERLPAMERPFSPPPFVEPLTQLQRWLSELEELRIEPARADHGEYQPRLKLGVRRSFPADESDVKHIEREYRIRVPEELRDFWLATNGLSFLGHQVSGTYDPCLLDWPGEKRILLMPNPYGDGSLIAVEVSEDTQGESSRACTFHYAPGVAEPIAVWDSLQDCLTHLISVVRDGADVDRGKDRSTAKKR